MTFKGRCSVTPRGYFVLHLGVWICVWIIMTNAGKPPSNFQRLGLGGIMAAGNTKFFECETDGSPKPSYTLNKDGAHFDSFPSSGFLKKENVQMSDIGVYQCISTNELGALLSTGGKLIVPYINPLSSTLPMTVTVNQGDATLIPLPDIDYEPKLMITWYKDDGNTRTSFDNVDSKSSRYHITLEKHLVILQVERSDDGMQFNANAVNVYLIPSGVETPKVTLNVQSSGSTSGHIQPTFVIRPRDTVAEKTKSVSLECVINARPIAGLTIDWYVTRGSDPKELVRAIPPYTLKTNGRQLTITKVEESHAGLYECRGRLTSDGTTYPAISASANLIVSGPPELEKESPSSVQPDYGQSVTLKCPFKYVTPANMKWYKNAKLLVFGPGTKFQVLSNGKLTIDAVYPSDNGVYQCFGKNQFGENFFATVLTVTSQPAKIVKKPSNAAAIEGEDVRIPCEVTGTPKPLIKWKKVNVFGETEIKTSGRFNITDKALYIQTTEVSDTGRYVCNASNDLGWDEADADLRVSIRTVIDQPPQDIDVIKGKTAHLKCGIRHSHDVTVLVKWYLNGVEVSGGRIQILPDYTLQISSIRNADIGEYRCQVLSVAGNDSKTARLKVIELPYRPTIVSVTLHPTSNRKVDISWSPGFDGNSPIQYFVIQSRQLPAADTVMGDDEGWKLLTTGIDSTSTLYTVENLQPAKSYQFHISAVNAVGEGPPSSPSEIITLPQQPPSGPPLSVVGSPRSNTSILVQWGEPDPDKWNGKILGYRIRFKPAGYPTDTYQYSNITRNSNLMTELTELIIFQQYNIEIAAYNAEGVGVYSRSINVWTKEGHPSDPPSEVEVQAISSTEVRVTFSPPAPQKINGINQGYKVRAVRRNETTQAAELLIPPDPRNMYGKQTGTLSNLDKFMTYWVTVLCYTNAGEGPSSAKKEVRTLENVPDEVQNMRFEDIYDTTIKVLWDSPEHVNGVLTGYTLIYGKKNQTAGHTQRDLSESTHKYIIQGLTAQTMYSITVYAKTRVGNGVPKTLDIKSGEKPEPPGPPVMLNIVSVGPRLVVLRFTPGSNGKTNIILWEIEALVGSSETWVKVYEEKAPNARELTVKNLKPYTKYKLRMRAVNIAGKSEPSDSTRLFETMAAEPSVAPGNVTVRAVNETAVRVRWTPLPVQYWNGVPTGYKISYRAGTNDTFTEVELPNSNGNGYMLTGLEEWTIYEVKLRAYNQEGDGPFSPISSDRTRESVPSRGPTRVEANAVSSTEIRVTWGDVPVLDQNGMIAGYKVLYSSQQIGPQQEKVEVRGSSTKMYKLTQLKKFVMYEIQVLAYTRIGDGKPSPNVPIREQTFEAVPGPPSRIYFPEVTYSQARVFWSPPFEPNGIIIGYSVAYRDEQNSPGTDTIYNSLGPNERDLTVRELAAQRTYIFSLKARTNVGWGPEAVVQVKTILNRKEPEAPSEPYIGSSMIGSRTMRISWSPGDDGYSPIRNFTIEYSKNRSAWTAIPDVIMANEEAYTVQGLKPYTKYRFRVAASNDIGMGPFSQPSQEQQTLQAKPDAPPIDLRVTPITRTSVKVTWKPPASDTWNGNLEGFKVEYRMVGNTYFEKNETVNTEITLTELHKGFNYEIQVSARNGIGLGPSSPPVTVYVGEAIPAAAPENVVKGLVTSTEILLRWEPPAADKQNGDLLGYKVYYWISATQGARRRKRNIDKSGVKMQAVTSSETQVRLTGLEKYTKYDISVSAFNAAGDGPNSTSVTVMTAEDVPGMPGPLKFTDIMMTSLVVNWDSPAEPNGIITNYFVTYRPTMAVAGVSTIVSTEVEGEIHYYQAKNLLEMVSYNFTVKARTGMGWGPENSGQVRTGPQSKSPEPPSKPDISSQSTSITLKWKNQGDPDNLIIGYLIQGRLENGTWEDILRLSSPEPEAIIPLSNLKLKTLYTFRIIAINKHGISAPSPLSLPYTTPDYDAKPFYQQFWFLIIVALSALIFIIVIIAVFLVMGRNRRKKDKHKGLSTAPSMDDGGFSAFAMRDTRHDPPPSAIPKQNGTLGRSKNNIFKAGPKLGPASLFSDDDSITKPPLPSDSSSCSDKPSDLDSVTETQASDSEPESEKPLGARGGFVNPYVADSIRKSWKEKHPSKAYSYTDSEPESYTFSINGGQHLQVNNRAGSRAPLPGFSSFV